MIVLFGATGDLAKRKLLPGMFHLAQVGLMPERFRIIGAARHAIEVEEFRELARQSVEASRPADSLAARPGSRSPSRCASPASATASSRSARRSPRAREELGGEAGVLYLPLAAAERRGRHGRGSSARSASARAPG